MALAKESQRVRRLGRLLPRCIYGVATEGEQGVHPLESIVPGSQPGVRHGMEKRAPDSSYHGVFRNRLRGTIRNQRAMRSQI